jgi:nitrite reductase/ring-hydroxylating ferredoxin subunit
MRTLPPFTLADRIEDLELLDPLAKVLTNTVNAVIKPRNLRDLLHGVWHGHSLHPLMVQVPLGTWLSAAVLDCLPGNSKAAATLVAVGVASAGPAAVAGAVDYSELHTQQQRIGAVHALANSTALTLYSVSLVQRLRGGSGKPLAFLGLGALMAGGWFGGHLAYRQTAGPNHVEDVPHRVPEGWQPLAPVDELVPGKLHRRMLGEVPLLVRRAGDGAINVLAETCSHLSGPLSEGEQRWIDGEACVQCPWHQSVFSLVTGEVVHGPATSPQPVFQTRVTDGMLEVCLPGAG